MNKVRFNKRLWRTGSIVVMLSVLAVVLVACGLDNVPPTATPNVSGVNAAPSVPTDTPTPLPTPTPTPTSIVVLLPTATPVPYYFGSGTEPPDLQGINGDLLTEAAKYGTPRGKIVTGGPGGTVAIVSTATPTPKATTPAAKGSTGVVTPIPVRTVAVPTTK